MKRLTTAFCTLLILTSTAWADAGIDSAELGATSAMDDRIPARSEASAKEMGGIWYSLKV